MGAGRIVSLAGRSAVRPHWQCMHIIGHAAGRESFETFMRSEGLDENELKLSGPPGGPSHCGSGAETLSCDPLLSEHIVTSSEVGAYIILCPGVINTTRDLDSGAARHRWWPWHL